MGKINHTLHHRAEPGYGAAAQVIAIRKASGKDNAVILAELAEISILMPEHLHFLAHIGTQGILPIPVAVWPGEFYHSQPPFLIFKSRFPGICLYNGRCANITPKKDYLIP